MTSANPQHFPENPLSSTDSESILTASSSSTVLGPGAITGRFLKAVGGKSLDLIVNVVIRRRLAVIKQTLEKSPHVLRYPQGGSEWQYMDDIHADLEELCRYGYSLYIRRTAANLVWSITLLTRSVPDPASSDTDIAPTNGQWEILLTQIQRYEDLLIESEDMDINASKEGLGTYLEIPDTLMDDYNGIQIGVKVEKKPTLRKKVMDNGPRARKIPAFRPHLFRSLRSKIALHIGPSPDIQNPYGPKLLVLGTGRVGKSTIVKQLRAIQGVQDDTRSYYTTITRILVESMKTILLHIKETENEEALYMEAKNFVISLPASALVDYSNPELIRLGCAFRLLWNLPRVHESARRLKAESLLPDSTEYFFNSVDRIFVPDYMPTREDITRAQIPTIGIRETMLNVGPHTWCLMDAGGTRAERKKWIHHFENATIILFVVALSDYNKPLYEDRTVNCMQESLTLFESIVNSSWFTNTPIILLFNKVDVFKKELKVSPLKNWMPEYKGETYDDARVFIEQRFFNLVLEQRRPLSIHFVSAVDTAAVSGFLQTIRFDVDRHYEEQMSIL